MTLARPDYDVFVSYARVDNEIQKSVARLLDHLKGLFRSISGREARIFIDVSSVETAQLWEDRMKVALDNSSILLAVLSASYFTSDWCAREWDHFASGESRRRLNLGLGAEQGLIFPIKLKSWDHVLWVSTEQQRWIDEVGRRQHVNLDGLTPASRVFKSNTATLVRDIVEILARKRPEPDTSAPRTEIDPVSVQTNYGHRAPMVNQHERDFLDLLSQAKSMMTLGTTHKGLAEHLENALALKRAQTGSMTFWRSLRIIFPNESALATVDDELTAKFPDRSQATEEREAVARDAKQAITRFLVRANHPRNWDTYDCTSNVPFLGSFFEMPNGEKIVDVAILRPGYALSDHLFHRFSSVDSPEIVTYYQTTFEDIVGRSDRLDQFIVVGKPVSEDRPGFEIRRSVNRRSLLVSDEPNDDWVAAVVILLWRDVAGEIQPLLQIRTSDNSTREIDFLSNISGYIDERDCPKVGIGPRSRFLISRSTVENAVNRELCEELSTSEVAWSSLKLEDEHRFYYPDKENMYFYLCSTKLELSIESVRRKTQLHYWPFERLLQVREWQVLSKTSQVLGTDPRNWSGLRIAGEILAANLILHRQPDLADRLAEVLKSHEGFQALRDEIQDRIRTSQSTYEFRGSKRSVLGLAGLQYREFFSSVVPIYAHLGVTGALECLEWMNSHQTADIARKRLQQHYRRRESVGNVGANI